MASKNFFITGVTEKVLDEYITACGPDYLLRRIRQAKVLRRFSYALLAFTAAAAIIFAGAIGNLYNEYLHAHDSDIAYYEEYIR